jgi:hypothetical protein
MLILSLPPLELVLASHRAPTRSFVSSWTHRSCRIRVLSVPLVAIISSSLGSLSSISPNFSMYHRRGRHSICHRWCWEEPTGQFSESSDPLLVSDVLLHQDLLPCWCCLPAKPSPATDRPAWRQSQPGRATGDRPDNVHSTSRYPASRWRTRPKTTILPFLAP